MKYRVTNCDGTIVMTKQAAPPKPCRLCDNRREDRCQKYLVKCRTAQRDFDIPECCYGRTVKGAKRPIWDRWEDQ